MGVRKSTKRTKAEIEVDQPVEMETANEIKSEASSQPVDEPKELQPKAAFVPVLMQFKEGFWCARLMRSFMPGNYVAKTQQEVDALLPYSVIK